MAKQSSKSTDRIISYEEFRLLLEDPNVFIIEDNGPSTKVKGSTWRTVVYMNHTEEDIFVMNKEEK